MCSANFDNMKTDWFMCMYTPLYCHNTHQYRRLSKWPQNFKTWKGWENWAAWFKRKKSKWPSFHLSWCLQVCSSVHVVQLVCVCVWYVIYEYGSWRDVYGAMIFSPSMMCMHISCVHLCVLVFMNPMLSWLICVFHRRFNILCYA